ncbi:WXG100 family type VII secretion target [Paenibacillus polymyxa]|uniref:WXG100 family type VII secretion target n=3 Tax=Paenibacillus polymyxa TaxID=1406 RepID=UPI0025B68F58|nr:WXG100 family type VII secretion target [Paenibacillus polymyxa]MDN4086178.1 WXG100 family type VII secretion target [Paenibacillus polymyxa]MDN4087065.1 WXG100 family type VII secretion target [Paenibacillus polymyxa]MDN4108686.1 WXG100 family type VII secretion target [Paenibacillus polymyxa]
MTTIKVTPEQLMTVSKKFERAQQLVTQMNSNLVQQISSMGQLWEGITKEHFYYSFQTSQKNMNDFVTLTDSISKELRHHADKFRLADLMETGNIDASCLPPPPNSCAVPAPDTRNAFQKSVDSLTELGQDFVDANSVRYEKKFDSVWSFLDYMSYGIPKGMYQGYMERAAKQNDSWNDMLNFGTFGVTGMIQGAFNPTNAWSKEHWANMIGTAGLFGGVSSVIKPKISLKSSFKYEGAVDLRQISSDGLRNELPLTDVQKTEIIQYTKSLNFPEDNIIMSRPGFYDDWNTGMMYDRFVINTDVLPAEHTGVGTLSANSRVSAKATIAHEIVGHYEAYKSGKAFELYDVTPDTFKRNFALDEAQASIRAARFAPDLTSIERMTLLRDAMTRLKSADLRIRDVKGELYIEER